MHTQSKKGFHVTFFMVLVILQSCCSLPFSVTFSKMLYNFEMEPSEIDIGIATLATAKDGAKTNCEKRVCPEGSAFHNDTSKCYKLLERGPCGNLQLFYRLTGDSQYGACACMSNSDGCSQFVKGNRLILPGKDSKRCFLAYTQGPCESKDEWYVLDTKTLKPLCEKNMCSSKRDTKQQANLKKQPSTGEGDLSKFVQEESDVFSFENNGTCYQTFTQGFCQPGEYVQFLGTNDPYPRCFPLTSGPPKCHQTIFGVGPVVGMPCAPGYKLIGDDCVVANIEFE